MFLTRYSRQQSNMVSESSVLGWTSAGQLFNGYLQTV